MPYVKQSRRPALDEVLDELVKIDPKSIDIQKFLLAVAGVEINSWKYKLISNERIFNAFKKAKEIDLQPNGDINYILFKYAKYHIKPSYNNYKTFMGDLYILIPDFPREYKDELREAAEWIRIKILTPYEEKAIEKNGDV